MTRIFMNGNSQAVRIPAQFRIEGDRVWISRTAQGDLVLQPVQRARGAALREALQGLHAVDARFVEALEAERRDQSPNQDRDAL